MKWSHGLNSAKDTKCFIAYGTPNCSAVTFSYQRWQAIMSTWQDLGTPKRQPPGMPVKAWLSWWGQSRWEEAPHWAELFPGLDKKERSRWAVTVLMRCSLTADAVWQSASGLCLCLPCHDGLTSKTMSPNKHFLSPLSQGVLSSEQEE